MIAIKQKKILKNVFCDLGKRPNKLTVKIDGIMHIIIPVNC
jgi:hypothetical protein